MKKTKEGGESIAVVKTFHSQIDSKHCSSVWRSSFPDHLGICWKLYTLPETPNHLVCTLPLFLSVTVPKIAVPNSALECFSKRWWKTWVVVNVVQWPMTVPWKKTTSLCNLLLTLSLHNQTHAKPFYNQPGNLRGWTVLYPLLSIVCGIHPFAGY